MEWLLQHATSLSPTSIYLFLGGVLLLCGLGAPIPEDISLITGGYLAHLGLVNVHSMLAMCLATVLGGDLIAFSIGRFFGQRLLASPFGARMLPPRKQLRVRAYFRKWGSKMIFLGRFMPGLRFVIFLSAGTLHVRFAVFFLFDALAAVLSVPALVYLAYAFGDKIDAVVAWSRRSEYGILVIAALLVAFVVVRLSRARRKRKQLEGAETLKQSA